MTRDPVVRVDRVVVRCNVPASLTGEGLRALLVRELRQRLEGSRIGASGEISRVSVSLPHDARLADAASVSRAMADGVAGAIRHG